MKLIGIPQSTSAGQNRRTYSTILGNATAGDTVFAVTYEQGRVDAFLGGVRLVPDRDFTRTANGIGTSITLITGISTGDYLELVGHLGTAGNAVSTFNYVVGTSSGSYAGSTTVFPVTHNSGDKVNFYLNGVLLDSTDYSTSPSTGEVTLGTAAATGDYVEVQVIGALVSSSDATFASVTAGQLTSDNIQIDGNTISSTDTDGDIILSPDGSGNVGIGTDSPIGRLHVKSDITTSFYLESTYPTTGKKWLINSRADNGNLQIFNASDSVDVMRIYSSGNVELKTTNAKLILPSGGGIDFSAYGAGTNIDSNLLNDYEEGTWTPKITEGTGGTDTVTSVNSATYTKIGRLVTLFFNVTCSSASGSAGYLEGLPFDGVASSGNVGVMIERGSGGSSYTFEMLYVNSFLIVTNTTSSTIGASSLSGTQRGSLTYYTA